VVVRRVLHGESGPTGGPAFSDLLGVMESWGDGVTTVRAESGEATTIPLADIVSGKPVPPRPSVRLRVSADEAERRANASWPALVAEPLGEWLLRASDGFSSRANSCLAAGDPGVPFGDALERVAGFYRARGLPVWVQVVVRSDVHPALESAGWVPARPCVADTHFQIGSVARSLRAARGMLPPVVPPVVRTPTATPGWLANDERARSRPEAARAVLEGPDRVVFPTVAGAAGGNPIAKGRAGMATGSDWVGITDVWVSPAQRRQGLGVVVMADLLGWAAEQGATTAYLQTRGDNPAALALYERLGLLTHHEYRYLTPPRS
jgi:GNAT superfamily N-acetyltransferase